MKCTCGATVPLSSRSSLCQSCLNAPDPDDPDSWDRDEEYGRDYGPGGDEGEEDRYGGEGWGDDHGRYDDEGGY
jgi:hypothetical protein